MLWLASLAGLLMFAWPLLLVPDPGAAQVAPPFLFLALLPVVVLVVLAELSEGGMDARSMALLGVLTAVNAALRSLSAGVAGVELVFFLLVLAGRVFGPGFGFVLGCTSLFTSALLTSGVGPWLPYQMLCAAWVGLGAGLLPRRAFGRPLVGRREIAMLVVYGIVCAYLFGLLMNLSSWPYTLGIAINGYEGALSYVPGAPLEENLKRFGVYTLLTSTGGWDTGRAITNSVAIVLLGPGGAGHPAAGGARSRTPQRSSRDTTPGEQLMVRLPAGVRGMAGRDDAWAAWVAALPGVADALLAEWGLRQDGWAQHGYTALVLPVRDRRGPGRHAQDRLPRRGVGVRAPGAAEVAGRGRGAAAAGGPAPARDAAGAARGPHPRQPGRGRGLRGRGRALRAAARAGPSAAGPALDRARPLGPRSCARCRAAPRCRTGWSSRPPRWPRTSPPTRPPTGGWSTATCTSRTCWPRTGGRGWRSTPSR